jgi:KaiC/GvpD/RAD55 family RecA-like ATPase
VLGGRRVFVLEMDADGTQYAAIMAADRGQSMVVIGPPGSGKAQTITDFIAVAMAEGKRVLFVAQKLAALRVV